MHLILEIWWFIQYIEAWWCIYCMHQWTGSSLVHVMNWHLSSAKPLPEPILIFCQLGPWHQEQTSMELKYSNYHSQKNAFEQVYCKMALILFKPHCVNSLRPWQNGRHFADDIFKCIFFNENIWIPINISMKFVPKGSIKNMQALVQVMSWRHPGDRPLSEPMMVGLLTHICVTRPQWVDKHQGYH